MQPRVMTRIQWTALLVIICTGFASQMVMPLWISAVIKSLGLTDEVAGRIGSLEYGAVALVSVVVGLRLQHIAAYPALVLGVALLVLGNLGAVFATDALTLGCARVVCGFGKGLVVAISFGLLAATPHPTRSFALLNCAYSLFATLYYLALPMVVEAHGARGIFAAMGLSAAVGAVFLIWYPRMPMVRSKMAGLKLSALPGFGLVAIAALICLNMGHAATWIFIARIGESAHIAPRVIGAVLSAAAFLTIGGPLLARFIHTRRGFGLPMAIGILLKAAAVFLLIYGRSDLAFYIAAPTFLLLNLFVLPYVMGILSIADPVGRLAAASSAAQAAGAAGGALLGGIMVSFAGYEGLAWLSGTLFLIFLMLVSIIAPRADRRARQS